MISRSGQDAAEPTPGRGALDDLRFELKQGDAYEQHLSSRIEDALDVQTEAWLEWLARFRVAGVPGEPLTAIEHDGSADYAERIARERADGDEHKPGPKRMVGRRVKQDCWMCGQSWPCEGSWQARALTVAAYCREHRGEEGFSWVRCDDILAIIRGEAVVIRGFIEIPVEAESD